MRFHAGSFWIFAAIFVAATCVPHSANATEWDIYLVAGQSNAAGWNTAASGLPSALRNQADVRFFNGPDGSWGNLVTGSGNRSTSFGPEMTLGRTLADENPNRNIAIVKYAVGGANLNVQWNPISAEPNLYDEFITTINNAVAAIPAGDTHSFKGMVWMQGETDAAFTDMTAAYETNLTNLISQVRQDVGVADLPFSIGQLGAVPGRDGMGTIQSVQAEVAARDSNVSLVITSSLALQSDNLHFTNDAQQELGIQFAAGVQGELNEIQIANPSFESTNQTDGEANSRNVSGWEQSDISVTGNFNPDTSFYSDTNSLDSNGGEVGAMDATNVLFFASNNSAEFVTQTLSSVAEIGTTYNLTVAVGHRDLSTRDRFAGYRIQLLSDDQVLASVISTDSPGDGTFTDISLTYTVTSDDPIGPLSIRLGSNRGGSRRATDFDDVRLTATPPALGDFNGDGNIDGDDVDFYIGNLDQFATGELERLDLTGDGALTIVDHNVHVTILVTTSNGVTGALLGDVNLDGTVDVLNDAFALVASLGQSATSRSQGDLNADGVVDVLNDAFILIGQLGQSN
ncbi:hypothetical protein N9L06_07125 [Mariniblastus sp.]|nr:hypothetical protein [Mariniblastus sp.]